MCESRVSIQAKSIGSLLQELQIIVQSLCHNFGSQCNYFLEVLTITLRLLLVRKLDQTLDDPSSPDEVFGTRQSERLVDQ